MHQLTDGLIKRGMSVKVAALDPFSDGRENALPAEYMDKTAYEALPIDTSIRLHKALFNLFTRQSYNISRFYSKQVEERIAKILQQDHFDIIQLEGLYLTPYIPVIRRHSAASLLFRSHNIEHFIWERLAKTARNPLKKIYLSILARRLKLFEMKTVHQVDGLIAISHVDLHFFRQNGFSHPAVTIPVGVDERWQPAGDNPGDNYTAFHIGSMDWRPNQEGLAWFMEEVWPLVVAEKPGLVFVLAGRNVPGEFYRYQSDQIRILGEVEDARHFMHGHGLMIVPLRSGGGMRVKIIEGMAAGKAIVSTSIGAEGIHCTHGENILLADTAGEMAEAILYCFSNKDEMIKLGRNAASFAQKNHSVPVYMDHLIEFYQAFSEK